MRCASASGYAAPWASATPGACVRKKRTSSCAARSIACRSMGQNVVRSDASSDTWDRLRQLLVRFILRLGAVLDPHQVDAVATQRLELPIRPPEVVPSERRDEVRELVPEPVQDLPQMFTLLVGVGRRERERRARQDPTSVKERPERPHVDLVQRSLVPEEDLSLGPVGQDEEHVPRATEVVEEQRFSEPADERALVGDDIGERLIGRDHTEVEIGVRVGRAGCMRTRQERGDDPIIGSAGVDESRDHDAGVMSHRSTSWPRSGAGCRTCRRRRRS